MCHIFLTLLLLHFLSLALKVYTFLFCIHHFIPLFQNRGIKYDSSNLLKFYSIQQDWFNGNQLEYFWYSICCLRHSVRLHWMKEGLYSLNTKSKIKIGWVHFNFQNFVLHCLEINLLDTSVSVEAWPAVFVNWLGQIHQCSIRESSG